MTITKCDDCGVEIKNIHFVTDACAYGEDSVAEGFRFISVYYEAGTAPLLKFRVVEVCFHCARRKGLKAYDEAR